MGETKIPPSRNPARDVLIFALLIVYVVGVRAFMSYQLEIPGQGTLVKVGCEVYWDEDRTQVVNEFNWGLLEPGEQKMFTVWIVNTGTIPGKLSGFTKNWVPSNAQTYITQTSSTPGNGTIAIFPDETLEIHVFLDVSPDIEGIDTFSYVTVVEISEI